MFNLKIKAAEAPIFGCFLFLLVWLPIPLGSNRPWAWALVEFITFALLLALLTFNASGIYNCLKQYKLAFILATLFCVFQLLLIIPLPYEVIAVIRPDRLMSINSEEGPLMALSYDAAQSKITLLKTLAYVSLFLITLTLVKTSKRIRLLLLTICLAGSIQAIYGAFEVLLNIQKSIIFKYNVTHIATGSFVYKNHFANYLVLTLSAALGYLIACRNPQRKLVRRRDILRYCLDFLLSKKALVRISIIIMVIALIMSRSRMGNTAFFAAMTITSMLGLVLFKTKTKSFTALFISLLVIDLFLVSSVFGLSEVKQRIEQTNFEKETRDEVIQDTLPLLSRFKLLGSGGGTFYTLYPHVQSDKVQHFYDHAHNEYLQFTLEFGWIATFILSILGMTCFIAAVISLRTRERPAYLGAAFASVMAFIGMGMHSTVDFPLQAPANAATFVVILALGLISKKRKSSQ
ncbi:polymerase [Alteromonas sp. 345S023]|uniref:Polymerase n=1 Tax=Alteromonas profundi TaxID=2696062 RepID=A0A7X5LIE8_9ALTE|nr:polymerase [Alteromonas profundi]